MELVLLLPKMVITIGFVAIVSYLLHLWLDLIVKPAKLRSKLQKQGITGPKPTFLKGNIPQITKAARSQQSTLSSPSQDTTNQTITHNCASILFPLFEQWRQQYGKIYMFSLGKIQLLYLSHPDVVKEISMSTSLRFGKPSYQQKERGPLLGKGILTSNGAAWQHQRKILAPQFYMDKVKGMVQKMVESSETVLNSWNTMIENEGGVADIKIDEYLWSFSGDVISRACFGSNYEKGKEIFLKLKCLQDAMSKKVLSSGTPGMRYFPTKINREIWKREKEVRELILEVVNERRKVESLEKDLLQMILEEAENSEIKLGKEMTDRFVVDNCKNIYLAAYDTTAVCASWTLMLLASNPEWQDRVRAEVIQVCQGRKPDADMLRKMKTLTMVLQESLRLYPPVTVVSREALQDMQFGDLYVPKGVNIWILVVTLHQDPEIWGPDADKFNPERFSNGVSGSCKLPHVYIPFGIGPRTCLGQNFAMADLKILLAMIVSNFSFSLSPKYRHSPTMRMVIEPQHGVNLILKKL